MFETIQPTKNNIHKVDGIVLKIKLKIMLHFNLSNWVLFLIYFILSQNQKYAELRKKKAINEI